MAEGRAATVGSVACWKQWGRRADPHVDRRGIPSARCSSSCLQVADFNLSRMLEKAQHGTAMSSSGVPINPIWLVRMDEAGCLTAEQGWQLNWQGFSDRSRWLDRSDGPTDQTARLGCAHS